MEDGEAPGIYTEVLYCSENKLQIIWPHLQGSVLCGLFLVSFLCHNTFHYYGSSGLVIPHSFHTFSWHFSLSWNDQNSCLLYEAFASLSLFPAGLLCTQLLRLCITQLQRCQHSLYCAGLCSVKLSQPCMVASSSFP
jgi:hypothetical protein